MRVEIFILIVVFLTERVYEDHEALVDNLMIWTRDSKNRLLFVKRPERTMLFEQPELLSGPNSTTRGDYVDKCSRNNMIEVSSIYSSILSDFSNLKDSWH